MSQFISNPEDFLHMLVHHVGDADSWDDFKKVGGNASVQAGHTFLRYDVFELAHHAQLGLPFCGGYKKKEGKKLSTRLRMTCFFFPLDSVVQMQPCACIRVRIRARG